MKLFKKLVEKLKTLDNSMPLPKTTGIAKRIQGDWDIETDFVKVNCYITKITNWRSKKKILLYDSSSYNEAEIAHCKAIRTIYQRAAFVTDIYGVTHTLKY